MHAEAVDDEKLRLLAFEDRWHFVALLCLKAQGTLDSGAPRLESRVALKLGLQLPQLDELKRRLLEINRIDDTFQPVSWGKRQYDSDNSTKRVSALRARKLANRQAQEKKPGANRKRKGNVSVTPPEQSRAETEQILKKATDVAGRREEAKRLWPRVLAAIRADDLRKSFPEGGDVQRAVRLIGGWQRLGSKNTNLKGQTEQEFLNAYAELT
jgi:hypothetical protein